VLFTASVKVASVAWMVTGLEASPFRIVVSWPVFTTTYNTRQVANSHESVKNDNRHHVVFVKS
jgi:hypothetical protein